MTQIRPQLWWLGLLLIGCNPIPESIPQVPGDFSDEDDLRRLWLPASPDNAISPFFIITLLNTSALGDCPLEEATDDGTTYVGNGCQDSAGRIWNGQAVERDDEEATVWDFIGWGIDYADVYWTLDGRMSWELIESNYQFQSSLAMDFGDEEDEFEAWQRLSFFLDFFQQSVHCIFVFRYTDCVIRVKHLV